MNERIAELWDKAAEDTMDQSWESQTKFMERFAELIVRECVQTLLDNTPMLDENESVEDWNKGYIRAMSDCEHHIKEHFGLES